MVAISDDLGERASNVESKRNERLQQLIHHAYETSPFWKHRFDLCGMSPDQISSAVDLARLPLLEKEEVRRDINAIRSRHFTDRECVKSFTGGSTAAPMAFYRDSQCQLFREANRWYYYQQMGRRFTDVQGLVWGASQDLPLRQNLKSRLSMFVLHRTVALPGNRICDETMARFCSAARWCRVDYLHGYAQAIVQLAQFVQRTGRRAPSLNSISVTAEPIHPDQQAFVSEVFQCPVFQVYGTREFGFVAGEFPGSEGLFVNPMNVIVEIVDHHGNTVHDNSPGQIVITDLVNRDATDSLPHWRYWPMASLSAIAIVVLGHRGRARNRFPGHRQ